MICSIGSITGIIVTAILCVVAYDMGMNASRPQIEPFAMDTSIPPWRPPEFEFKTETVNTDSIEEIVDEINRLDTEDYRFCQIMHIIYTTSDISSFKHRCNAKLLFRALKQTDKEKPTPPPTRKINEGSDKPTISRGRVDN